MAAISKSRPSFVKVMVEVDLLKENLKRINVGVKKKYSGENHLNIDNIHINVYAKVLKILQKAEA